jgi:hypothetical protein
MEKPQTWGEAALMDLFHHTELLFLDLRQALPQTAMKQHHIDHQQDPIWESLTL